jgi:hypothetical protein
MKLAFLTPALALGVTLFLSGAPASAQDQHHGATHGAAMRGGAMHGNAMRGNAMRRPTGYTNYRYGGTYNGYRPGYSGNGWAYTGGVHYWRHHRAYWRNGVWGYYGPSGLWISIPL